LDHALIYVVGREERDRGALMAKSSVKTLSTKFISHSFQNTAK
jgi:hypothetical protein